MVMKMSMIVMIMIIHKIHDRSRCDSCIGMIISITDGNCHNEYDYDMIIAMIITPRMILIPITIQTILKEQMLIFLFRFIIGASVGFTANR